MSQTPGLPLVAVRKLVKAYETPSGPFLALRGVDLHVQTGEFVAVIGKSGSGKSTLINAIAGIDRPTSGEINVAGTAVHSLDENETAAWRGSNLGVIFQFFQLLPTLTLLENVMLPMEFARRGTSATRRDRALALLDRVEMAAHADKLPSAVSGGQQQRVAIARALANDPALIVADEPTGSLDSRTADTIFQLFEELVDHGKTILMVTHDNDLAGRASRVVLIADGDVVEPHVRTALSGITEQELSTVTARLEPISLPEGATVFTEGDEADRFYIIVRGALDVIRSLAGREECLAVLGPGQYFGEIGLLEGTLRNASVRVSGDAGASLLALDAETFRRLVTDNHLAHDAIAAVMRRRMTAASIRESVPTLDDQRLAEVEASIERSTYAPGETVIHPSDPIDRFRVVTGGVLEVELEGGDGGEYRLREGRYLSSTGFTRDGRSVARVRVPTDAVEPTEVIGIPEDVRAALAAETGLGDTHLALLLIDAGRKP